MDLNSLEWKPVEKPDIASLDWKPVEPEKSYTVPGRITREQFLSDEKLLSTVRAHMVDRHGVDYETVEPEQLLSDFTVRQRYIDVGNPVSLTKESLFLRRADDAARVRAAEAYKIWENFEGLWNTPSGALDSATDYAEAILTDPITYVGIGVGRLVTTGGAKVASQAVRQAAAQAARKALAAAPTRAAGRQAAQQAVASTARSAARTQAAKRIGLMAGFEGAANAAADAGSQGVRMMADPEREFNAPSTVLSGILGAAAGGGSVAFDLLFDPSRGKALANALRKPPSKEEVVKLKKKTLDEVIAKLSKVADWDAAVIRGTDALGSDRALSPELLKQLFFGSEGSGGIVNAMAASDVTFTKGDIARQTLDFLTDLPDGVRASYDKLIETATGGSIKSLDDFADMMARSANLGGQVFNIFSNVSKSVVNGRLNQAAIRAGLEGDTISDPKALGEVFSASNYEAYMRNVWRRMLVSAFPTTAVNVTGSSIYLAGSVAQDVLLATGYALRGNFTKANAYRHVLVDRARNLFNPRANKEVLNQLYSINPSSLEALRDVQNMGVRTPKNLEDLYKQFGFESAGERRIAGVTETLVDGAQRLTLVKAQDIFFKSFGLVDQLSRIARLKHGRSLDDLILSGDFRKLITEDDIGRSVHETLKMTFSADYTTRNRRLTGMSVWQAEAAKFLETISNSPAGYIFPFGRFTNNIIANTIQHSPITLATELAPYLTRKGYSADANVIAKAMVGTAAMATAYQIAQERRETTGDPWHVIRLGPDRFDVKNVYPLSAILLFGDLAYSLNTGEKTTTEVVRDLGEQVAIGQVGTDLNVVDFTEAILNMMVTSAEEGLAGREGGLGPFSTEAGKFIGSIVAGFTRPLTTPDDLVGLLTNNLQTLDRKQIEGDHWARRFGNAASMEASRYVNRTLQFLVDPTGSNPPDDFIFLRQPTREGRTEQMDPLLRQFAGVPTMQQRTHAEKMMEMAGMPSWTATFRSQHPQYNRYINEHMAPILDRMAKSLVNTDRFINAPETERRVMVREILSVVREDMRKMMERGADKTTFIWGIQNRLMNLRRNRNTADVYHLAVQDLGLTTKEPKNMTPEEAILLLEHIEARQNSVKR